VGIISSKPCDEVKEVESAGLQRAVYGTNGPGFRLHFDDAGNIAPDVFQPVTRPGIRLLRHR
jgi:hypothetical protein